MIFDFNDRPTYTPPLGDEILFSFDSSHNVTQTLKLGLTVNNDIKKLFIVSQKLTLTVSLTNSIYKSISGYGPATILFNEPEPIQQIALTFDQLGRPLVFYRVGADTLKLYWYDPVLQESVNVVIATGVDPQAGFDFPQDTGQSFSDALLFYVRDDTVYMRVQRDRFAVEYLCPASKSGLRLVSNGLRVDNRYQVVYQYPDNDYVPPVVPVPPIPVTGDYYYLNSWGSCLISNYKMDVVNDPFKLGFKVRDAFYPRGPAQYMFGSDDRKQLYCAMGSGSVTIYRGYRWGSAMLIVPGEDFNGEWEFEFFGVSGDVLIKKDGATLFNKNLVRPQPDRTKLTNIVFAGSETKPGLESLPFHGCVYDCWVEHNGNRIDWAVQNNGQAQQPSVPAGNDMTIRNHRPQNWQFIPG